MKFAFDCNKSTATGPSNIKKEQKSKCRKEDHQNSKEWIDKNMTKSCISTFQDKPSPPIQTCAHWTVHRQKATPWPLQQLRRAYVYSRSYVQLTQLSVIRELNILQTRITAMKVAERQQQTWAELKPSKSEIWGAGSGPAKPTYPLASRDHVNSRDTRPCHRLSKHNIKLSQ